MRLIPATNQFCDHLTGFALRSGITNCHSFAETGMFVQCRQTLNDLREHLSRQPFRDCRDELWRSCYSMRFHRLAPKKWTTTLFERGSKQCSIHILVATLAQGFWSEKASVAGSAMQSDTISNRMVLHAKWI